MEQAQTLSHTSITRTTPNYIYHSTILITHFLEWTSYSGCWMLFNFHFNNNRKSTLSWVFILKTWTKTLCWRVNRFITVEAPTLIFDTCIVKPFEPFISKQLIKTYVWGFFSKNRDWFSTLEKSFLCIHFGPKILVWCQFG